MPLNSTKLRAFLRAHNVMKEVEGLQSHHKVLASEHVNHKLARACTKAIQKTNPKAAELTMRLRYGAFLGKPKNNVCPLCKEEGVILQHDGDDSIHSCDYVGHVLHACTAEQAVAARAEAQEVCDAWAVCGHHQA